MLIIFVIIIAIYKFVNIALTFTGILLVTFNQMIVAILKSHDLDSNQPRFKSSLYYLLAV